MTDDGGYLEYVRFERIIVCGGRDYIERSLVYSLLSALCPDEVIHGGCPGGADLFAHDWVKERKVIETVFEPAWLKQGKKAGPLRNQEIADYAVKPIKTSPKSRSKVEPFVICLAFPGGRGTEDMVSKAKRRNIPVLRVEE